MYKRLLLAITVFIAVIPGLYAQGLTAADIVKVSGKLSADKLKRGQEFQLAVVLDIKPKFHINANIPTADFPTKIQLNQSAGVKLGAAKYPREDMKAFDFAPNKIPVYEGRVVVKLPGKVEKSAALGKRLLTGKLIYQACDDLSCYPPSEVAFSIPVEIVKPDVKVKPANGELFKNRPAKPASVDTQTNDLAGRIEKGGFLFLFLAGMGLCLTPCVYPMIPVVVGYFGNQGEGRRSRIGILALLFVLGLAITYSLMGTAAAYAGTGFGSVMQSPMIPIVIAAILVVLALSLFGVYEIPVPGFIASRSQSRSGALGALSMGLIFGLVAAPCVGPAVAALLFVVAKIGSPLKGFSMFFTLSLGMGVPFFFLAIFSGSLTRLPRAGMWMDTVRKVFGFLLLGTAIYYISQLLPKDTARLAIPAFLIAAGAYWALFERSTRQMRIVRPIQQVLGISVIAIGAWTIFAPTHPSIEWTQYTPQAVAAAKEAGKPIIIDFTADWCIPCHEMDKATFSDPAVYKESRRFVRLSVDLTRKSKSTDQVAKTYKVNGPPTVILIDSTGKEQGKVVGFTKPDGFLIHLRGVK